METKSYTLQCGPYVLHLGSRTAVMGIINVTPDSFFDGGRYFETSSAIQRAYQMIEDGADIIDVGGESTRPASKPVPAQEEIRRIGPVLKELLRGDIGVPISVDTNKPEVARFALDLGAGMVNAVGGFSFHTELAKVVAGYPVAVVLTHILGLPETMQVHPTYRALIPEIKTFLRINIQLGVAAGVQRHRTIIDPGIGFGKTVDHNLTIIARLGEFASLHRPILIGPSRKSFIQQVLGQPKEKCFEGSIVAVALSIINGARIVRVHDVAEMVRAVRMADGLKSVGCQNPTKGSALAALGHDRGEYLAGI